MAVTPMGLPDQLAMRAASRYVRAIFFCKLLLSAVVIPIAIAGLCELPHIGDDGESQFQVTPILATVTLGSFYLALGLLGLKLFAVYFPVFGPVCGAPVHSTLWHATMFTLGLLIDAMLITPRIFLGSAIDSLSQPQPTTTPLALFSKNTNVLLLILIAPIAAVTYQAWRPFYTDYTVQAREQYRAKNEITPDERERWAYFHEEIREALAAKTLDKAFGFTMSLRNSVNRLPYKDERHRRDANGCLDTAEDHLTVCHTGNRTHPDYWQAKYRKAVSEIPKYPGALPEIPGPVID